MVHSDRRTAGRVGQRKALVVEGQEITVGVTRQKRGEGFVCLQAGVGIVWNASFAVFRCSNNDRFADSASWWVWRKRTGVRTAEPRGRDFHITKRSFEMSQQMGDDLDNDLRWMDDDTHYEFD